jgi:hypothetical protein
MHDLRIAIVISALNSILMGAYFWYFWNALVEEKSFFMWVFHVGFNISLFTGTPILIGHFVPININAALFHQAMLIFMCSYVATGAPLLISLLIAQEKYKKRKKLLESGNTQR